MEYRYWDIINVPRSNEGAKTSAPSDDTITESPVIIGVDVAIAEDKTDSVAETTDVVEDKTEDVIDVDFKEVNPDEIENAVEFSKTEESDNEKKDEIIETLKRVETKLDEQNDDRYISAEQLSEILKNCSYTGGNNTPVTELNEDQICDVLRTFEKYQELYFKDIPMRSEICRRFLFNIPKRVYDTHVAVSECYNNPDVFDPLYWLYLCFTECKREDVAVFVKAAANILIENDEEIAEGYDDILGTTYEEEDEDIDDEVEDVDDVTVTVEDVEDNE